MKRLKTTAALLLSGLMLLITPVSFAQTQETYRDDFNKYTKDETMPWSGYPGSIASDLFVKASGSGGQIYATAGQDGKAVLQLSTKMDGNAVSLHTKSLNYSAGHEVLLNAEFCVKSFGDHPELLVDSYRASLGSRVDFSAMFIYISYCADGSAGPGVYFVRQDPGGGTKHVLAPCETDVWYSMMVLQTATGRTIRLAKPDGTVVFDETLSVAPKATENVMVARLAAFKASNAVTTKIDMQFDNAVLSRIDPTNDIPSCVAASIDDQAKAVKRNQKLAFSFDQRVNGTPVLLADGVPVGGTSVLQTGPCDIELCYDGLLNKNTTYTVQLSGVTNSAGRACDAADITFTTESLHLWNDIDVLNIAAGSGDNVIVDFSISDTYGYQSFSGAVLAAVYADGMMKAVDMVLLNNASTKDPITESFSLGGLPGEGETLSLMLLDVDGAPIPLAVGTK